MTDWNSPETLKSNAASFRNLTHALFGLYIWEWGNSLVFEWGLIRGRYKFRLPLIPYFWCRYAELGGLIALIIGLDNTTRPMNCKVLYYISTSLAATSIGAASMNLAIRTIAVYRDTKVVLYFLVALILGQWVLVVKSMTTLHAEWVTGTGCYMTNTDSHILTAFYIYTMSLDFIVLVLMAHKLGISFKVEEGLVVQSCRSQIAKTLFTDGLAYFLMMFIVNVVAVVFSVLNLNPIMAIVGDLPAAVLSVVFSCRFVRRFFMTQKKKKITREPASVHFTTNHGASTNLNSEVHVPMDTFAKSDTEEPDEEQDSKSRDVKSIV